MLNKKKESKKKMVVAFSMLPFAIQASVLGAEATQSRMVVNNGMISDNRLGSGYQVNRDEAQFVNENGERETEVKAYISPTISISIPKTINISTETKEAEYEINVKGDIGSNTTISVHPFKEKPRDFVLLEIEQGNQTTDGILSLLGDKNEELEQSETSMLSKSSEKLESGEKPIETSPFDEEDEMWNKFYMYEKSNSEIKKAPVLATITQEEYIWNFQDVCAENGTSKVGTVSAPDLSSGDWNGIMNFRIKVITSQRVLDLLG